MPLRARVDDRWLVAPLVPADEWRVLTADLRAGRRLARLPCCDGLAFGRTSAQGLAHFVHQRRDDCAAGRESLDHLRLKVAVLRAVEATGWGVEPEAEGPDWRADVLATPHLPTTLDDLLDGSRQPRLWRVAFEVQLSRIDGPTLLERQARYQHDRVRGCWLVGPAAGGRRRQPPTDPTGPTATTRSDRSAGWQGAALTTRLGLPDDTPAFALLTGEEPAVICAGQPVPLGAFVTALLTRQARYLPAMTPAALPLRTLIYEAFCPACRGRCHPHLVAGWFVAICGARGPVRRRPNNTSGAGAPEFEPVVLTAVQDHAATPAGRDLRPCPVHPVGAAGRPAFLCPDCDRPLPPGHLAHAAWPVRRGESAPVAALPLPVLAGLECVTEQPHWCLTTNGNSCDGGLRGA